MNKKKLAKSLKRSERTKKKQLSAGLEKLFQKLDQVIDDHPETVKEAIGNILEHKN